MAINIDCNLNPYKTLGIKLGDGEKTIKIAYRKLSLKYHPDKPEGDQQKFIDINTSYEILSDPSKKAEYLSECEKNFNFVFNFGQRESTEFHFNSKTETKNEDSISSTFFLGFGIFAILIISAINEVVYNFLEKADRDRCEEAVKKHYCYLTKQDQDMKIAEYCFDHDDL